jgi:hypothetical protein
VRTWDERKSLSDPIGKVFELRDVKDGTAGHMACKAIGIQFDAYFNCVFRYPRHIVVRDVVLRTVGKANPKGPERLGLKHVAYLASSNHSRTASGQSLVVPSFFVFFAFFCG